VLWGRVDDERRKELFQHIAVLLEHQRKELLGIMRDQVNFEAIVDPDFSTVSCIGFRPTTSCSGN